MLGCQFQPVSQKSTFFILQAFFIACDTPYYTLEAYWAHENGVLLTRVRKTRQPGKLLNVLSVFFVCSALYSDGLFTEFL